MVAPGLPLVAIHALLNYGPLAIVSYKETMEVKVEAVLDGRTVHLGHQAACPRQCLCVKADAVADLGEFLRRSARMPATSAANMDAKFGFERCETSFERPDHAGRNAGRMPVHPHHCSKRLEPEGMG